MALITKRLDRLVSSGTRPIEIKGLGKVQARMVRELLVYKFLFIKIYQVVIDEYFVYGTEDILLSSHESSLRVGVYRNNGYLIDKAYLMQENAIAEELRNTQRVVGANFSVLQGICSRLGVDFDKLANEGKVNHGEGESKQ